MRNAFNIYLKDKHRLYSFDNEHKATEWLEEHPQDVQNIIFFSDQPLGDLVLAKEEVLLQFDCQGCGVGLKGYRHPKETFVKVQCPLCGTIHGVHTSDDSTPSDEGNES